MLSVSSDGSCVSLSASVVSLSASVCVNSIRSFFSVSLDGSCARKAKTNREVYTVRAAEVDREDGRKGCAIVDAAVAAFTLAPQQGRRVRHHNT